MCWNIPRSTVTCFIFCVIFACFLHSACSPADKEWDTCILCLTILVLSEIVALAALWVLHYKVIEPADSVWYCQSFKVIAVMQSFNAEGKRCFFFFCLTSRRIANTGAVLKQSRNLVCPILAKGTVILNIPDRDHNARVSGFYMQKLAVNIWSCICWVRFFSFPFVFTPSAFATTSSFVVSGCPVLPLGPWQVIMWLEVLKHLICTV